MGTEHRDHHHHHHRDGGGGGGGGKPGLLTWWQKHTAQKQPRQTSAAALAQAHKGFDYVPPPPGIVFGRPLKESLKFANVQVSTADTSGQLYVWGHIPVVVAKCGLFLKENATEIEGTFRVNGSNKRMRELQAIFETPPRYGKSLDWKKENYTTHDVASVFRRYLTHLPEPVIPYDLYFPFRDAIARKPYNQEMVISTYKRLIQTMPPANQYLLLYVLDLLSVFARKSDRNLMTAQNLAVIFRPGLMSHPSHELSPSEHRLSQEVLEFLIAYQDWFMLDTPLPSALPPAPSRSLTPPLSAANVSVSDDEGPDGWRLIDRHTRPAMERGRSGPGTSALAPQTPGRGERDQMPMSSAAGTLLGSPGIQRSRTVPSSRKGRASTVDPGNMQRGAMTMAGVSGSAPNPGLLRKARRASAQPV